MLKIFIAITLGAVIAAADLTAVPIVFPFLSIILTPIFLVLYLKFDFKRIFYFALASGAVFDIFAPTKVGFWIMVLMLLAVVIYYLKYYVIKNEGLVIIVGTSAGYLGINLANCLSSRQINFLNLILTLILELALAIILWHVGNQIFFKKSQLPLIKL